MSPEASTYSVVPQDPDATAGRERSVFYAELDFETRIAVSDAAERIRGHGRRRIASAIAQGQELLAVKAKLGHGRFGRWLAIEFDASQDTAENLMYIARQAEAHPQIAEYVGPLSALYRQSARRTTARKTRQHEESEESEEPEEHVESDPVGRALDLFGHSVVMNLRAARDLASIGKSINYSHGRQQYFSALQQDESDLRPLVARNLYDFGLMLVDGSKPFLIEEDE